MMEIKTRVDDLGVRLKVEDTGVLGGRLISR